MAPSQGVVDIVIDIATVADGHDPTLRVADEVPAPPQDALAL